MNNSIYTDVAEWLAEIVKPRKQLNGLSICPYAEKSSWEVICDQDVDVKLCTQDVTIFVLPRQMSKKKMEQYAQQLKQKHHTYVFLPDHKDANTRIKNIATGNGKHNLMLVQKRKKLDTARRVLEKRSYYDYMDAEYKKKLFDY
jgi:hypothetical protein